MDVRCGQCGTDYEFDDALLSSHGTMVRCTACGHRFKVFPAHATGGAVPERWIVDKSTGRQQVFTSLKGLQKAIAAGVVQRHDRLTRGGETRQIGDIGELDPLLTRHAAAPAPAPRTLVGIAPVPSTQHSAASTETQQAAASESVSSGQIPDTPDKSLTGHPSLRPTDEMDPAPAAQKPVRKRTVRGIEDSVLAAIQLGHDEIIAQPARADRTPEPVVPASSERPPPDRSVVPNRTQPPEPVVPASSEPPPSANPSPAPSAGSEPAPPASRDLPEPAQPAGPAQPAERTAADAATGIASARASRSAPRHESSDELPATPRAQPPGARAPAHARASVEARPPAAAQTRPRQATAARRKPTRSAFPAWIGAAVGFALLVVLGLALRSRLAARGAPPSDTGSVVRPTEEGRLAVMVNRARTLIGNSDLRGARAALDRARALAPNDTRVLGELGRWHTQQAELLWWQTLLLEDDESRLRAVQQRLDSEISRARSAADLAISRGEATTAMLWVRPALARLAGDARRAQRRTEQMISSGLKPSPYLEAALGMALGSADWRTLAGQFRTAASAHRGPSPAQVGLVVSLVRLGRFDEANEELAALAEQPSTGALTRDLRRFWQRQKQDRANDTQVPQPIMAQPSVQEEPPPTEPAAKFRQQLRAAAQTLQEAEARDAEAPSTDPPDTVPDTGPEPEGAGSASPLAPAPASPAPAPSASTSAPAGEDEPPATPPSASTSAPAGEDELPATPPSASTSAPAGEDELPATPPPASTSAPAGEDEPPATPPSAASP